MSDSKRVSELWPFEVSSYRKVRWGEIVNPIVKPVAIPISILVGKLFGPMCKFARFMGRNLPISWAARHGVATPKRPNLPRNERNSSHKASKFTHWADPSLFLFAPFYGSRRSSSDSKRLPIDRRHFTRETLVVLSLLASAE